MKSDALVNVPKTRFTRFGQAVLATILSTMLVTPATSDDAISGIKESEQAFLAGVSDAFAQLVEEVHDTVSQLEDTGENEKAETLNAELDAMKNTGVLPRNRLVAREVNAYKKRFEHEMRSLLFDYTQAMRLARQDNRPDRAKSLSDLRRSLADIAPIGPSAIVLPTNKGGAPDAITPDTRYEIHQIKPDFALTGGLSIQDMNNLGELTGMYHARGEHRGYIWRDGKFTELETKEAVRTTAVRSINDKSEITGYFVTTQTSFVAFVWRDGDFATFPMDRGGPVLINNSRQVVGGINASKIFNVSGKGRVTLECQIDGQITSMNNNGKVVGRTRAVGPAGNRMFPFVAAAKNQWRPKLIRPKGAIEGEATWISDTGIIVGTYKDEDGDEHGFMVVDGKLKDFPKVHGQSFLPRCVNSSGVVVGRLEGPSGGAMVYLNGQLIELHRLTNGLKKGEVHDAYIINDKGQIVARAHNDKGRIATHRRNEDILLSPISR